MCAYMKNVFLKHSLLRVYQAPPDTVCGHTGLQRRTPEHTTGRTMQLLQLRYNMVHAIPRQAVMTTRRIVEVKINAAEAEMSTSSFLPLRRRTDRLQNRLGKVNQHCRRQSTQCPYGINHHSTCGGHFRRWHQRWQLKLCRFVAPV